MIRRQTWDETWTEVAQVIARRSTCTLFQAGAVIVSTDNRILSTGYNGAPRNLASQRLGRGAVCADECPRGRGEVARDQGYGLNCISVHAEANALLFVDRSQCEGGTIFVNGVSCDDCLKLIANSGVKRVVAVDDEAPNRPWLRAYRYLALCSIQLDKAP